MQINKHGNVVNDSGVKSPSVSAKVGKLGMSAVLKTYGKLVGPTPMKNVDSVPSQKS